MGIGNSGSTTAIDYSITMVPDADIMHMYAHVTIVTWPVSLLLQYLAMPSSLNVNSASNPCPRCRGLVPVKLAKGRKHPSHY
jgi:hypothetical protein